MSFGTYLAMRKLVSANDEHDERCDFGDGPSDCVVTLPRQDTGSVLTNESQVRGGRGSEAMAGSRINRELECVNVLAGLDHVENRIYVYTAAYRTPDGVPPEYEIEATLVCPESVGEFDLPVLPMPCIRWLGVKTSTAQARIVTQLPSWRRCSGWNKRMKPIISICASD